MYFYFIHAEEETNSSITLHGYTTQTFNSQNLIYKSITVTNIYSPLIYYSKTESNLKIFLKMLNKKNINFEIEKRTMKNYFYKNLDEQLDVIYIKLNSFLKDNLNLPNCFIQKEFSSPVEQFLIQKNVKGCCLFKIQKYFESKNEYFVSDLSFIEFVSNDDFKFGVSAFLEVSVCDGNVVAYNLCLKKETQDPKKEINNSKKETNKIDFLKNDPKKEINNESKKMNKMDSMQKDITKMGINNYEKEINNENQRINNENKIDSSKNDNTNCNKSSINNENLSFFTNNRIITGFIKSQNTELNKIAKKLGYNLYKSSYELTNHLKGIIGYEKPYILVYHNVDSKIINEIKHKGILLCDLFVCSQGFLAGKTFSLSEMFDNLDKCNLVEFVPNDFSFEINKMYQTHKARSINNNNSNGKDNNESLYNNERFNNIDNPNNNTSNTNTYNINNNHNNNNNNINNNNINNNHSFSLKDTYILQIKETFTNLYKIHSIYTQLHILELCKQLTEISGNLLNRTLQNQRAERNDYLLLHECYKQNILFPSLKKCKSEKSFTGGLVLKPVDGFHENLVLLLDFNSLYPSIILEYNVCFSTVGRLLAEDTQEETKEETKKNDSMNNEGVDKELDGENNNDNNEDINNNDSDINISKYGKNNKDISEYGNSNINISKYGNNTNKTIIDTNKTNINTNKTIIDTNKTTINTNKTIVNDDLEISNLYEEITEKSTKMPQGFLPKIIQTLITRRKSVKSLLKTCKTKSEHNTLETRQKALKLTANSIYGCLGTEYSRFSNLKMASLITHKGRSILKKSVEICEHTLDLKVIYGDTDSIMVDTKLAGINSNYKLSLVLANNLRKLINNYFVYLEIDVEKVFKKLVLFTKKKYGGLVIDSQGNSKIECRGLDFVRRDVPLCAAEICKKVLGIMLSDLENEYYTKDNNKDNNRDVNGDNNRDVNFDNNRDNNNDTNKDNNNDINDNTIISNTISDNISVTISNTMTPTTIISNNFSSDCGEKSNFIFIKNNGNPIITQKIKECIIEYSKTLKQLPKSHFTIHKQLNKDPDNYKHQELQPHIVLAQKLRKRNIKCSKDDIISYIICKGLKKEPINTRAHLPTEAIHIDYSYYVENIIAPCLFRIISKFSGFYSDDISKIFGIINVCKLIKFNKIHLLTSCCNTTQEPKLVCDSCGCKMSIPYLEAKIYELLRVQIQFLYKTVYVCKQCECKFNSFVRNCGLCGMLMNENLGNESFDSFLNSLLVSFEDIESCKNLVEKIMGLSEYRIIDFRKYFNNEIDRCGNITY